MSHNQSRSDKNDSAHYRKQGRPSNSSNLHRPSPSGSYAKGGGATGSAPPVSRRGQKPSNVQGGFSKLNPSSVAQPPVSAPLDHSNVSATSSRNLQNGTSHVSAQSPWQGTSDASVAVEVRQTETLVQTKSSKTFQASSSSDATSLTTPVKSAGDSSKSAYSFQFGTLSPGLMNGMQIPARTNSAPPNLDEQKRDHVNRVSHQNMPSIPASIPKQQPPKKDVASEKVNSADSHAMPKPKKETQAPPPPPANQIPNPSILPYAVPAIQVPFHQPPTAVPFGAPNQQMQSQAIPASSIQMHVPVPVGLPLGNSTQVQQPMFVPSLQAHPMQPQGIMHQGQGLSFSTPIGPLTNMGLGVSTQYPPQQQGGKYSSQRKTAVKITDPRTREDIRLVDGISTGLRSHSNVPQSQPISSFTLPHMSYYPPYAGGNIFYPGQGSVSISSGQVAPPTSQAPRYTFPKPVDSSASNSHLGNKLSNVMHAVTEHVNLDNHYDARNVLSSQSTGVVHVTVKAPPSPIIENPGKLASETSLRTEPFGAQKTFDEGTLPQTTGQQSKSLSSQSMSETLPQAKFVNVEKVILDPISGLGDENLAHPQNSSSAGGIEALNEVISTKDAQKMDKKSLPLQDVGCATPILTSSPRSLTHDKVYDGLSSDALQSTRTNIPSLVYREDRSDRFKVESALTEVENLVADETMHSSYKAVESSLVLDSLPHQEPGKPSIQEEIRDDSHTGTSSSLLGEQQSDQSANPKGLRLEKLIEQSNDVMIPVGSSSGNEVSINVDPVTCPSENSQIVHDKEEEVSTSMCSDWHDTHGAAVKPDVSALQTDAVVALNFLSDTAKQEVEAIETATETLVPALSVKDKATADLNRSKSMSSKMKKKRKEYLQKADAAGTTSDLYMAYKGPEERKEATVSVVFTDNSMLISVEKELPSDESVSDSIVTMVKTEPDDWEDAVDMSTSKMDQSNVVTHSDSGHVECKANLAKKYSRDFLLKFSERLSQLPDGFEITVDISEALNIKDLHPSPGRVMDRSNSASRMERRGGNVPDDVRWSKMPGTFVPGRDLRVDVGFAGNPGFRPGQGGNYGVLRAPRPQTPQPYLTGILSGPLQSTSAQGQGGVTRNTLDAERWQRSTSFQHRGLIPSPQTPLQVMHKAEKKYEVGKASNEEEVKQRQLKAILNKLTPQNFEKLFEQVKAVNIDNAITLKDVISQIFDKALMEPTFCEMYANFCSRLAGELPDFSENGEKVTFKRLLVTKCQEEFERGEREEEEANKADEEGEAKQTKEEREEKRLQARRRMLGNIRLIGELYKKRMLTERIMHECINKLLGEYENPDEENVEALCKLMSTIGEMIDHPKAKYHMDSYFDKMAMLSDNLKLSSRIRFMLKDAIDLRKNKWQQRRKVEGPKKIDDVHRDAAQERSLQTSRLARTPSMGQSARRGLMDMGPRGSATLSPSTSMGGGLRALPTQSRGFGTQDVRFEERQSYDTRSLGPLPQRSLGDDSIITLGPQGGLARGMSVGSPSSASTLSSDSADSKRMMSGYNGHANPSEKSTFNTKEDLHARYASERYSGPSSDQYSNQERNLNTENRDSRNTERGLDRSGVTWHSRAPTQAYANIGSSEKMPEDVLQEKSMAAIKEYYSARDEKEVALCIKELNSPSFHPSMISLWITDSFERKDLERDLLSKLLVNLTSSRETVVTTQNLVRGFESVLNNLEDAVNDAPRAAEFLGRVFAKVVVDNVVSLQVVGKLLLEGGEEPGRLLEVGVAGDVLASVLETVRVEKGDAVLNDLKVSSNLTIEDFLPNDPYRCRTLQKFV